MNDRDNLRQELMGKFAEMESKHKRRLPPDDIQLRFRRDMENSKAGTYVISKELFCKAIRLLQEQEAIDNEFGRALQKVGNGHFVFGTENKYREALLMVLKDGLNDQYDYTDWWLYEGAPDYKVWSEDESREWDLTEPEALYDFITTECK